MKSPAPFCSAAAAGLVLALHPLSAAAADADPVEALLSRMTLAEKIGQMTQVDSSALKDKSDIQKFCLGSVLSGGDSDPADNSPKSWLALTSECQAWAQKTRLKIPLLYGIDAVHGHNNVDGAVIFPHNIGLGATHDPGLVEQAERVTAEEMAGTGINWAFAPCVAVAQDPRWGRTYESFSDQPGLAGQMGAAAVRGLQGRDFSTPGAVLACAKHFVADGGTQNGVDQGNAVMNEATLRNIHLASYLPALDAGVGSVMASFSSWNGVKMHGNKYLLTDVLKGELGFKGFIVSDWAAIDQLPHDYEGDIEAAINAGLDMVMIPNGPGQPHNYAEFTADLTDLAKTGRVPMSRIDDAVRRILRAKADVGALTPKPVDPALTAAIGSASHREIARACVRESLVVLRNNQTTLPLAKNLKHVAVVGAAADDLGRQCGGWTISWQGATGNVTHGGTTVLAGIRRAVAVAGTQVTFSADASGIEGADAVIVVVGEMPYAEMKGDRQDLRLADADQALIKKAKAMGAPVVTVLLSGRPLILGDALETSDAFIAAWLPGTEGEGVADVLFGDFKPTGKLPRVWPRDNDALNSATAAAQPQFPFGYGLTYVTTGSPLKTASTAH
jgi:beta-glucosidase